MRIAPEGDRLIYSTYLGDWVTPDWARTVAVDESGNAYVGGTGVWAVNAAATSLLWSTALTGADFRSLALDGKGTLLATGRAESAAFYTTAQAAQKEADLFPSAFATNFRTDDGAVRASTLLSRAGSLTAGNHVRAGAGGTVLLGGTFVEGSPYERGYYAVFNSKLSAVAPFWDHPGISDIFVEPAGDGIVAVYNLNTQGQSIRIDRVAFSPSLP